MECTEYVHLVWAKCHEHLCGNLQLADLSALWLLLALHQCIVLVIVQQLQ